MTAATGPGSDEPFHYTADSGATFEIPSISRIKSGLIRKTRKMTEADMMYTILEAIADENALAALDDMDSQELARFMEAWSDHSGVQLGESKAS